MNLETNPNNPTEDEYFLSERLFFVCWVDVLYWLYGLYLSDDVVVPFVVSHACRDDSGSDSWLARISLIVVHTAYSHLSVSLWESLRSETCFMSRMILSYYWFVFSFFLFLNESVFELQKVKKSPRCWWTLSTRLHTVWMSESFTWEDIWSFSPLKQFILKFLFQMFFFFKFDSSWLNVCLFAVVELSIKGTVIITDFSPYIWNNINVPFFCFCSQRNLKTFLIS